MISTESEVSHLNKDRRYYNQMESNPSCRIEIDFKTDLQPEVNGCIMYRQT